MAGWHHQCIEHELGQTLADDEGPGGLACGSLWGRKDLDKTGQLNNNDKGKRKGGSVSSSPDEDMGLCGQASIEDKGTT